MVRSPWPKTVEGAVAAPITQIAGQLLGGKAVEAVVPKINDLLTNESSGGSPKGPPPASTDDMYDGADKLYSQADAAKAIIGAPKVQNIIADGQAALANSNFDPDFHPQTAKLLSKLEDASTDDGGNPVDMAWSKVNGYRKLLNGVINDSMKQGGTEDGYQAITLRNALDDATGAIGPSDLAGGDASAIPLTKQANALWSAATKSDTIQSILDKGQNAAVPATAYKNGFNKLANSPAFNTYTREEQAAIQHAAETGLVTGALKTMGGRLISGVAGATGGIMGGGFHGAMLGAAAGEGVGFPLRATANALQRSRGTAVQDLIGQRPAVQEALSTAANPQGPPAPAAPPATQQPPTPQQPIGAPANLPLANMAGNALAQARQKTGQNPGAPDAQPLAANTPAFTFPSLISDAKADEAPPDPITQKFAQAESNGNPNAKNPLSSASGLMQFTNPTWKYLVAKYGKQTGIQLGDKADPAAQATMAKLYASENIPVLQKALGRNPTIGELYAAHVLGGNGAAKLFNAAMANPSRQAVTVFSPKVVDANKQIFFNGDRPRSAADVYKLLSTKVA